jgi:hypothetical protein
VDSKGWKIEWELGTEKNIHTGSGLQVLSLFKLYQDFTSREQIDQIAYWEA